MKMTGKVVDQGRKSPAWHGVNLGNWLLLERWIQPSLFSDFPAAKDEFSLAAALGSDAEAFFRRHRESYITREDFRWLRDYGITAVRIPLGYWLVEAQAPFVGGIEYLDQAIALCREFGIAAVLDLHGAPGHQSNQHHTGRADFAQWHLDPKWRVQTLDVLEALAQRYRDEPAVEAISVLNEVAGATDAGLVLEFYHQAYERIRRHMPPERAAIIIEAHPHFRLAKFHGKLQTLGCQNVITDIHPYQAFYDKYTRLEIHEHLALPMGETYPRLAEAQQAGPLVIGEWSLTLGHDEKLVRLEPRHQELAIRAFAAAQLALFEQTAGWFFWTYKTENAPVWSLRECVRRRWFPETLGTGMNALQG